MAFLEGSRAIALTVANLSPEVVSAYPITPQTHIVEDLARFKADGREDYEYVLAESEAAAASIVLGASAAGSRTYTATSSQGLLLMLEVLYNAAGLRLPLLMTVANRAVGGPINIWNDHSDAMAMRDAGWLMFFAENHQEACDWHVIACRLAESLGIPAAVNVDGFILTHSFEKVSIPDKKTIKRFLAAYRPAKGTYLDPKHPATLGGFFGPEHYWLERKKLDEDMKAAQAEISRLYLEWKKIFPSDCAIKPRFDNGLVEYTGPAAPKTLLIAMGSMCGTIKEKLKEDKTAGLLKIRSFRPFPTKDVTRFIAKADRIAVIEKAASAGSAGPLYLEVSVAAGGKDINGNIVGLGGRDVSRRIISDIIKNAGRTGQRYW
ncbi:MAG: pyruvate ferredoxin oxidoreductase [Bacillota bacterium]